jgi:cell division septation protein DedD
MPIIEEEPVIVSENEFVLIEHPEVKNPSNVWKYLAAAVLLPVGFYSFWLPMKTNVLESGMLSIKDFNPGYKAIEGSYIKSDFAKIKVVKNSQPSLEESIKSLPSDVDTYSYAFDEDTYIPVKISDSKTKVETKEKAESVKETVKQIEVSKPIVQKETKTTIQPSIKKIEKVVAEKTVLETKLKNFDFIVGSFATDASATVLVNQLKANGLKAYLISDNSGKHRVSAGSASTIEEIKSIAEKVKTNGVEGWILRK